MFIFRKLSCIPPAEIYLFWIIHRDPEKNLPLSGDGRAVRPCPKYARGRENLVRVKTVIMPWFQPKARVTESAGSLSET